MFKTTNLRIVNKAQQFSIVRLLHVRQYCPVSGSGSLCKPGSFRESDSLFVSWPFRALNQMSQPLVCPFVWLPYDTESVQSLYYRPYDTARIWLHGNVIMPLNSVAKMIFNHQKTFGSLYHKIWPYPKRSPDDVEPTTTLFGTWQISFLTNAIGLHRLNSFDWAVRKVY